MLLLYLQLFANRSSLHMLYRENVMLLSLSLHANVIFIWEEVRGSYYQVNHITKRRNVQPTLRSNRLE